MHIKLKINSIKALDHIPNYWTLADYKALLEKFNYEDNATLSLEEAEEMLYIAITDFEPDEAAKILFQYKLSDTLKAGQIEQMSHEMQEDCLPEEYPNIALHYPLFSINQMLNRAFDGSFPETKATQIEFSLEAKGVDDEAVTHAIILQAMYLCMKKETIIDRLFDEQLVGKIPFPEAENIIWEIHHKGPHEYSIITSKYWLEREDFSENEAEGKINVYEPDEED